MLSFRTMQSPERIAGLRARIGFRIGEESFVAAIADGSVQTERGDPEAADAIFTGRPEAIAAAVYGGVPFEGLGGALTVDGDLALARRFATLFPLPDKVGG
jgi:hypothetical protein